MSIVNQKDIDKLFKKDKHFKQIYDAYGHPPNWARQEGFTSLSKIILEQQVSLASANAHFLRLNSYITDFIPRNILLLSDEEMRSCQISRQKTKYLRALSTALINNELDIENLKNLDEAIIREQLTGIKGIGHWTADIYLMFCLQAKDIFPIGDIAILNTIRELYNVTNRDEILALAEKWKPLRSLASYFLWHHYLKKRNREAPEYS